MTDTTTATPTTTVRQKNIYALVALYVTGVVMFVVSIAWSNHVAADSYNRSFNNTRQICGLLTVLDDIYLQTPPTTPSGKQIAIKTHELVADYECRDLPKK